MNFSVRKFFSWLLLGIVLVLGSPAEANPPEIVKTMGEADYNEAFMFHITATDLDGDIISAYVEYAWISDDVKVRKPIRFEKWQGKIDENVKIPATRDWRPPGSKLVYQWFVQDSTGQLTAGPVQEIVYQDNRYEWKKIETEHFITFHYESPRDAELIAQIAEESWSRITADIGHELTEKTRIYVYADQFDYLEVGDDSLRDWAGGSAYTADNLFILPASNDQDWLRQLVPHEFTHIVLDGKLGQYESYAPLWLSEGMSMFEEDSPAAVTDYMSQVARAKAEGYLVPLSEMTDFYFRDDDEVALMYAQCFTIVKYLYDTYGQEKLSRYIDLIAQGQTDEEAMQAAYGLSPEAFEAGWLAFIGEQPAPRFGDVLMRGDVLLFSSLVLLLVIIGVVRYRVENRRRRARMRAEDEAAMDSDVAETMWYKPHRDINEDEGEDK